VTKRLSSSAQLPLFVFGTLRRGECNHDCLSGRYDRWLPATLCDFRRTQTSHGFPGIVPSPGDAVAGELFFICPDVFADTLERCDHLEDIPPGQLVGRYYRREMVAVETSQGQVTAWAYVDPRSAL
jgi:gamma-glutamylcyclotransferase (GGCT)/AIG2-like uncharacterized protein YtfP